MLSYNYCDIFLDIKKRKFASTKDAFLISIMATADTDLIIRFYVGFEESYQPVLFSD